MYPFNIKIFLAISVVLTFFISCSIKPQINKDEKLFDTHFLTKKDYLSLDTHRLNELTDDQFLERIQYDSPKIV